ncbi:hypothetical protein B0H16DRAFT_464696 [Mycena metata]|uniref:BTB domain-containing protein n=1 Tax=Mycena metata TaxID=1033252 RepID=A0AAD7KDR0_9AGAR|nr:hypothetical protein B0H16DRAFT_464696 [Mycena metata]
MSQPSAKRQRTQDAPITRSELWHTDGKCRSTSRKHAIPRSLGVLARNSQFFRDMQSLPQPPSQPTVEGCPVVELPDAEADVKFVLRALYTPTLLAEPALPLSTVGALIRLGRKYDFKDLFNSALRRLAFEKPHILQGIGGSTRGPPIYSNAHHFISSPGFYFDTVTLLSENRLWSLLPCACFRLVTMRNATQLFDGVSREDGALASLSFVDFA